MSAPRLSYIVNTFNKLPFLRTSMGLLLKHRQPDEEIVVVDGGSKDGTVPYLHDLADRGLIDKLVSEKDFGEAHGWNRGLLLASGALIKLISDDDVYHYPSIGACRRFMEENASVDLLWTDGGGLRLGHEGSPSRYLDWPSFSRWRAGKGLLYCCGLGLLFRRSSLPVVGLFNTSSRRIDGELALRVSTGPCKSAWYRGATYVRLENPASNAVKFGRQMLLEELAFKVAYYSLGRRLPTLGEMSRLVISFGRSVAREYLGSSRRLAAPALHQDPERLIAAAFERALGWLDAEADTNNRGLFDA